jgi:hypothetical protein
MHERVIDILLSFQFLQMEYCEIQQISSINDKSSGPKQSEMK